MRRISAFILGFWILSSAILAEPFYNLKYDSATGRISNNTSVDTPLVWIGGVESNEGKVLSSNDYTDTDKEKLTRLTDCYKGHFVDDTSLNSIYPTGASGWWATVESTDTM